MLNIRKKIALLSACILLAGSVTSASSYADEKLILIRDTDGEMQLLTGEDLDTIEVYNLPSLMTTYTKGEHGEALCYSTGRENCYIVTTAEGLPVDCIYDATEINPDEVNWTEEYADWFSQYPEGARLYDVGYRKTANAKRLFMRYDSVIDAVYFWKESNSQVYWEGSIGVSYAENTHTQIGELSIEDGQIIYRNMNGEEEELPYSISEEVRQRLLALPEPVLPMPVYESSPETLEASVAYLEAMKIGEDWNSRYNSWYASVEAENMTPAELEASRKAAGVESDYEMIQKSYTLCKELTEKYGHVYTSASPLARKRSQPINVELDPEAYYWTGKMDTNRKRAARESVTGYITVENGQISYRNLNDEEEPYALNEEIKQRLLQLSAPVTIPVCESIPDSLEAELRCQEIMEIGREWNERYDNWYASIDAENMTVDERTAAREAAGIESSSEMIRKSEELCDELIDEYSDYYLSANAILQYREDTLFPYPDINTKIRAESLWARVGDADSDGNVTASDAAAILKRITSINSGALYQDEEDKERQQEIYDINADKNIDAEDAALLLRYTSLKGTGEIQSVQEFVKTLS